MMLVFLELEIHTSTQTLKDDDNGIGFSIQSLPYSEINNVVVPLATDSKSSKISIDVVQSTLPNGTLVTWRIVL